MWQSHIGSKHIHKEGILETIPHRFQRKTGEGEWIEKKRETYLSMSTYLSIGKSSDRPGFGILVLSFTNSIPSNKLLKLF
jgi:hypothetical protein